MKLREQYAKFKAGLPATSITYEQWLEQQTKELKELLKVSVCPNKRCIDGVNGNYIRQAIQCKFCDERKQALK